MFYAVVNSGQRVTAPKVILATALLVAASATSVLGAESYVQNGIGARSKALAGAGVASSTDATAASLNPAGLVNVQSQVNVALSVLDVRGGTTASVGGGFNHDGWSKSDPDVMYIPNVAATWRVNWDLVDAIAFTGYGFGGVNTLYKDMPNSNCPPGMSGVFCGGKLGIRLVQENYELAFAKTLAPGLSVGVAPVVARQYGWIKGASLFSGFSADPAHFSNTGTDESWGFGVRGGIEWKATPGITLGVAGNSKFDMSKLNRYAGLLAEQGNFDLPPMVQAGVAFGLLPNLTLLVDYRHIWFSQVDSASNPSSNPLPFGTDIAPGYGVQDVDTIKVGLEWQQSPSLTLRAGYSYNTAPIGSRDADLNIMTLGVVQHHITGGLKYAVNDRFDLELAAMYAPEESVDGIELMTANRHVEIEGSQFEFTVGTTYKFGGDGK